MNVIKSKSSNVTIVSKPEKVNKKSRSNGEIQPLLIKKRGVYVENKFPKLHSEDAKEIEEPKRKSCPRSKPGQNGFLSSVYTILSKSTAETQYPDIKEDKSLETAAKAKPKKEIKKQTQTKKKYRSRILNQESYQDDKDQLIILQSRKDLMKTPSISASENTSEVIKWSAPAHKYSKNPIRDVLENNIYSGGLAKEILEGRSTSITFKDDPETAVDAVKQKDDTKIYNFFVDLLKTTFSVYNVKTDYQICEEASVESKTDIEINEVPKKHRISDEHFSINNLNNYTINDTMVDRHIKKKQNFFNSGNFFTYLPVQKQKKSMSFTYTKPKPKVLPKSNTFYAKKVPRQSKAARQKTFMNFLKQQLSMNDHNVEEPETLFDAIKVLAKNKKRCERAPQYYENTIQDSEKFDCVYESRKIISPRSRKNKKTDKLPKVTPLQDYNDYPRNDSDSAASLYPSCHSIEVHGYDFTDISFRPQFDESHKKMLFTHHKASGVDDNTDVNLLPKLSENSLQSDFHFNNFDFEKYT